MCPVVHYNQTYAPVESWGFIKIILSTVLRNNYKTVQIDYVLDFLQAPVERGFYFNTLKGVEVQSDIECLLKAKNNIYGNTMQAEYRINS